MVARIDTAAEQSEPRRRDWPGDFNSMVFRRKQQRTFRAAKGARPRPRDDVKILSGTYGSNGAAENNELLKWIKQNCFPGSSRARRQSGIMPV